MHLERACLGAQVSQNFSQSIKLVLEFTINNSVEFRMKSCIYTYMYCTHIISLSVTMDPIFPVCLCVLFSFLFVFIHFSCEKPASRLLPSPFFCYLLRKCCQKEQTTERETDSEREVGREKTKQKLQFLHYTMRRRFLVVVLSHLLWLLPLQKWNLSSSLSFMLRIYGPNKNKNKVKDFAYLFNKERPCMLLLLLLFVFLFFYYLR